MPNTAQGSETYKVITAQLYHAKFTAAFGHFPAQIQHVDP